MAQIKYAIFKREVSFWFKSESAAEKFVAWAKKFGKMEMEEVECRVVDLRVEEVPGIAPTDPEDAVLAPEGEGVEPPEQENAPEVKTLEEIEAEEEDCEAGQLESGGWSRGPDWPNY